MAFSAPVLAALPVILGVVSTGVAIAGVVQSTSAQIQQANYQKQIAERNAVISAENASRAAYRAQVEQQAQDDIGRAAIGSILAEQGASGLRIGGRSAMLTRKSAKQLARLDAENIRQAGDVEAHNYLMAAEDSKEAAKFSGQIASNALISGFIEGAGTLVGGASNLLSKFPQATTNSLLGARKLAGAAVPAAKTLRFAR